MIPSQLLPFANHLWQSTLFAAAVWLLTLFLRENRAQVRYLLWLAASVKFLIPFYILMDAGSYFARPSAVANAPADLPLVIEQVSAPFAVRSPVATISSGAVSSSYPILPILAVAWFLGFVTLIYSWMLRWRRMRASVQQASPMDLQFGLSIRTSPSFGEPGVFGLLHPVLLMPDRIDDCLTAQEMDAVVAHELCHVRRRDNLAAAIHMAVEAIFWFHPLVWWLRARLVEERERACDEEVLGAGGDPSEYAEGILKVCELYLASPLECVAGVTGGDLKRRIEAIMSEHVALRLTFAKKVALSVGAIAAVAAPVIVGIVHAPVMRAQSPQAAVPSKLRPLRNSMWHPSSPSQEDQADRWIPSIETGQWVAGLPPWPRLVDSKRPSLPSTS